MCESYTINPNYLTIKPKRMRCKNLTKTIIVLLVLAISQLAMAQDKVITGRVTDSKDASGVPGVTVAPKGARTGTQTSSDGSYRISVGSGVTVLVFSSIGYETQEVDISGRSSVDVVLVINNSQLGEVVVTGYGTARKKDLTGAVSSVKARDFNKGISPSPENLIQGKVPGVQVTQSSGDPGAGLTIRIRGAASLRAGNTPLFVIDGVPLDNTSPAGGSDIPDVGGGTPGRNPFNFINSSDIASIDILKDASAAAIYGSRGANGVVLITTKKGQTGLPRIEFGASYGVSNIMKRLEVLSGDEYRQALGDFGFPTTVNTPAVPTANFGSDVDALDEILQTGNIQNYYTSISSGNENARYRISLGYMDQKGIVLKSNFKKYTASLSSGFRFLESRRLGLDIGLTTAHIDEDLAPITNNAGFKGSIIGQALQWNPTRSLFNTDGTLFIGNTGNDINPLAMSAAFNDNPKTTTVLGNISPYFKITNDFEYRMLFSIQHSTGVRKTFIRNFLNLEGLMAPSATGRGGQAAITENELTIRNITHTLNYNKNLNENFELGALLGYEYQKITYKGSGTSARGFINTNQPYYNFFAYSDPSTRNIWSYEDPERELQSFFARGTVNIRDRYLFTATIRADGSSKFGENNRYGYFPSVAAAWNIMKESFMAGAARTFDNLKIRLGWGQTGNQEFPAGASQIVYVAGGNGSFNQLYLQNPDLKWETNTTLNVGIDFGVMRGRLTGSVDYFNKSTEDLLFPVQAADPQPPGSAVTWKNIDGNIKNTGVEIGLLGSVIRKTDFTWDLGLNLTFQKNELTDFIGEIPTGEVNGQGLSGAFAQLIKSGQPLNSFYLKKFIGVDKTTGISMYEGGEAKFFVGSPNPTTLVGITTRVGYKKLSLEVNMNGAYGHYIYNNTANAALSFNNLGKRNLGVRELEIARAEGERPVNPTSASSRYLEKGNYMKLSNATLSYGVGNMGRYIKGATIYITGQNLFVITDFTGFDPEVNVNKPLNDVPSFGMEYTPYPTSRTIILGINFAL